MPERRILETTQLLGALPPETLETLRQQATTPDGRPQRGALPPGRPRRRAVRHRQREASRSSPVRPTVASRWSRCSTRGRSSASSACSTTARARPTRARSRRPTSSCSATTPCARRSTRTPRCCGSSCGCSPRRLRSTDESLADAVFLDVPARTAKRLLELAGDADEFRLPMTQEDLAGLVGASRERVNKALSLFTRLGWIEVEGRSRYQHPRPPGAARPRHLCRPRVARGCVSRERGSASTRRQASAASSARWAGRSGACTKPCSASG